jgi:hypothetical protein
MEIVERVKKITQIYDASSHSALLLDSAKTDAQKQTQRY